MADSYRTSIKGDLLNVDTAGQRVKIPPLPCTEVTVIAKKNNVGSIYVGGSNVSSSTYGVELSQNESFTFKVTDASQVYIDAEISGEGISYVIPV